MATAEAKESKESKESAKETSKEKLKALQLTIDKLEKSYGKGTIMKLGDAAVEQIETISTGSISLDAALGIGGLPKGRVIEIYGPESSGKTTLAIHAIASAQRAGGIAAFIDAEHAFDRLYAQKLGVDIENLLISQPDNGEQALEIAENLIRSGAIDIIVIDSVAALTPKSEIEGEMGDSKMGLHARLMSQAMRKLTATISRTGCCCVFINQLREKIGVMFGNPETTTGGNALKFYASIRLDIRRIGQLKDGESIVGKNERQLLRVREKFGMVFQGAALFDSMTVAENVAFPLQRKHKNFTAGEIARGLEVKRRGAVRRPAGAVIKGKLDVNSKTMLMICSYESKLTYF